MKKLLKVIFLFILSAHASAQIMWQINKDTITTWNYDQGDEFNSSTLNTDYWEYWYGWARCIYSQKEQQYYTDGQNHILKDGQLILNAKKQPLTARLVDWREDNDSIIDDGVFMGMNKRSFNYTAGMIQTRKEILYGYFEIKFTMDPAKGYWPAFWLWGGTPNEEIDFCELKSEKKNKIHVGRHAQKNSDNYVPYFLFKKKLWGDWVTFKGDLTKGYNIIAGEWTKDYIKYYLNGECIAYTKVNFDVPKRLVANIAVPANNGPFKPGPPKTDSGYSEFKIDYIRIWSKADAGLGKKALIVPTDSYNAQRLPGKSALSSKTKILYGKKSLHKNEGFMVSLMPMGAKKYKITALGKNIPANAVYTLYDHEGKKLAGANLVYGESELSLEGYSSNQFTFNIEAFGKKCNYQISTITR